MASIDVPLINPIARFVAMNPHRPCDAFIGQKRAGGKSGA
jgi:hypothetical protein